LAIVVGGNRLPVEPRDPYDDVPPENGRTEVIEQEEQVPPPPWWREHWWVPLLVLLLLVGALLAFAFLWGSDDDDDDRVAVPDVVGLQEPDAREQIVAAGLEAQVDRVERDAAEGEVVAQEPGSGTELDEGDVVLLLVSQGATETQTETETIVETETETETDTETETATATETDTETETAEEEPDTTQMPDAAGADFRDAARAILDAGLLPTSYPVESDEPQGTVVAQEPDPGSELDEGSVVRINVSLGPGDRADATVPDLTGPEIEDALEDCHEAGFTCRVIERAAPDEESRGEALDQRPGAGTSAPALTQITLFLGV
jgi:eukaryotic-like serine/threonine-protein kinase